MFHKRPPYSGRTPTEMMKSINSTNITFDRHVCHEARDLILRILRKDQKKRLTIKEIMTHSFFKKFDYVVTFNDKQHIYVSNNGLSNRERSKDTRYIFL